MPRTSGPNATLSITLRHGKRLRFCQTMTESAPSGRATAGRAGSSIRTVPEVACSSPPTIWTSVLLPQPLGPSRQEKRRDANRCEKRSSATTSARLPPPQTCVTLSTTTSMRSLAPLSYQHYRAVGPAGTSHPPVRGETVAQARRRHHGLANPLGFDNRARNVIEAGELSVAVDD